MKYKVSYAHNFLRVFRMPKNYPSDYCFGGGHPVLIKMVDWFNAFSQLDFNIDTVKEFDVTEEWYQNHIKELRDFIRGKNYFNPEDTFLVLTDYGDAFIVNPELRANELQNELDKIITEAKQ